VRRLFRNASIVDGTGAAARSGDVLVEDDVIAEVAPVGGTSLAPDEVMELGGLTLAPGFIDMHSHSDFTLPGEPEARMKVMQGVTTEVIGNCGLGLFPANDKVEGFYAKLSPMIFGEPGGGCFATLAAYRAKLHERGISVNAAPLVSHGNVRCLAMSLEDRAPTANELDHMRDAVRQAMDEGAFGMSTGLVYAPGAYAKTEWPRRAASTRRTCATRARRSSSRSKKR
jgi:N-acyl-D-amino-acid deacylase